MSQNKTQKKVVRVFRAHGGQLHMSEAIGKGISRYALYSMRNMGIIEQVTRGVYRLTEMPPLSNPDLLTVGLRFPNAVICLVSALAFHEMTTQVPHEVFIAVARQSRVPSLDFPPVRAHRFSDEAFKAGVENHVIDAVSIRIYNPEKTLADCFKFRNRIGMDIVLEALKLYNSRKKFNAGLLLDYAKICRIEKIMLPYVEAMI